MAVTQFLKPFRKWRGWTDTDLLTAKQIKLNGVDLSIGHGHHLYVNPDSGSDSYGVSAPDRPFATMSRAFEDVRSGDTIHFRGKIKEQLTTPVQVFDVTIIGDGNRPRHADAAPSPLGGQAAATWAAPASPTAATPLLKILQQGWRLQNFVMAGTTDAACVLLYRDGGSGNAERDASHFESIGVRYASGRDGIEQSGGCYNVGIFGNWFHDLTGYAIKHTSGAGIAAPYRWDIEHNDFDGCANLMGAWAAHAFRFKHNDVHETTTNIIDFNSGSHNVVVDNTFDIAAVDFDPTGHVRGSSTDVWSNTLKDAVETGLPAD